jgi:cell division transport system permease protein
MSAAAPASRQRVAPPPRRGPIAALRVYVARHAQVFLASLGRLTRQPLGTAMTVVVIGIALALPASLEMLVRNARSATGSWNEALDLSVYFKREVKVAQVEQLARNLRARQGVESVRVIPADSALEEFREFSGFGPALDALEDNPLPHALVVRPAPDSSAPTDISALQRYLQNWPEVDLVQVDTEWVTRFHSILELLRRVVTLAGLLLAIGVVFIVGNTIRLDIENRRAEIEVIKLVGGSDAFVRRPFLYGGFWYGLFGGALACLLLAVGVWLLAEPVNRLAALYGSDFELAGIDLRSAGLLLGGGALLGWWGSWIAAARHLRSIEPTA